MSADLGDLSLACAWALVDELVAGGRAACVPLARLAIDPDRAGAGATSRRAPSTSIWTNDRAAFFALGLAKASRRPWRIACTSGTAAAEFLPAWWRRRSRATPLLVLTADRPPRLRGTGANQTIDQVGLYGGYVRECLDLPVPETPGQEAWWGQPARQALEARRSDPVGPVHVNCPLRRAPDALTDVAAPVRPRVSPSICPRRPRMPN